MENSNGEINNNKRGVTLIALVVTIVVLLILAGTTIAMLRGKNGILSEAESAKVATENKGAEEKVGLAISASRAKGMGTLEVEKLKEEVENNYAGSVIGEEFPITVTIDNKAFTVEGNGTTEIVNTDSIVKPTIGQIISLKSDENTTEYFYVLSYDEKTGLAKALAMYNLKVGANYDNSGNKLSDISTEETGYGLQGSEMKGWVREEQQYKGTVAFSSMSYWDDTTKYPNGASGYPYVYNKNEEKCTISQYLELYKQKLGNTDKIREVNLASYEDIDSLWSQKETYDWLYSTSYWLGSVENSGNNGVWLIYTDGILISNNNCYDPTTYGVRPVITIDMSKI